MTKINILFLTTTGVLNGAEKQLLYLLNNLNDGKFSATICTLKDEGELLSSIKNPNIMKYSLGISSILDFFKLFKLRMVIKKNSPDIIHSFLDVDNILAKIFGKIYGKIIINSQRNCNPFRSKKRDFFERITRELADYQISNSYAAKKLVLAKGLFDYPKKIYILPNCIEKKVIKNSVRENTELRIIAVGELSKQKNFSALMEALNGVENISLTIIGTGPLKNQLLNESKRYRVKLNLLGFVDNVDEYIIQSDILFHTSLWDGMPNVVMEAMALKIPIIASDVGDVKRLIIDGKSGFLLNTPIDNYEVRKKLSVLRNDKALRQTFTNNAYDEILKYSITRMCNTYENILKEIIEGDNDGK